MILLQLIKAEEDKEGYDVRIDKKSLARLLQRLAKDNLVKYIKLTLSDGERQKVVTYICDPTIEKNHSLIESAVEQAKIKFCLLRAPNLRVSKKGSQYDMKRKRGTYSIVNSREANSLDVDVVLDPVRISFAIFKISLYYIILFIIRLILITENRKEVWIQSEIPENEVPSHSAFLFDL